MSPSILDQEDSFLQRSCRVDIPLHLRHAKYRNKLQQKEVECFLSLADCGGTHLADHDHEAYASDEPSLQRTAQHNVNKSETEQAEQEGD